jgi:hypothetical protein
MKIKRAPLAAWSVLGIAALMCTFSASAAVANSESRNRDEPMAGEMKKKGMKQGEVKKHEEKWDRKMKEMVGNEEKARARGTTKKNSP